MCVIAFKPRNVAFPEERILQNCFENNPDGAGFMYPQGGKVHIRKGFETYKAFKAALDRVVKVTGDKIPFVMHFRIATQGFETGMTHPFPLTQSMSTMKKLRSKCSIGIAHNGVLFTSDGSKDYSDTMKFIADYLTNIIRNYSWHKDERTVKLIENLISGSRLAIMDKNGFVKLLGKTWTEDKDTKCWFSNTSYSYKKTTYYWGKSSSLYDDDYYDYYDDGYYLKPSKKVSQGSSQIGFQPQAPVVDDWEMFKKADGTYDFNEYSNCPFATEDDDSYCAKCANKGQCTYYQAAMGDQDEQESKAEGKVATAASPKLPTPKQWYANHKIMFGKEPTLDQWNNAILAYKWTKEDLKACFQ